MSNGTDCQNQSESQVQNEKVINKIDRLCSIRSINYSYKAKREKVVEKIKKEKERQNEKDEKVAVANGKVSKGNNGQNEKGRKTKKND